MAESGAGMTDLASPARHRFHAICPYFAMFPESFAAQWIESLTNPGDMVFDPFSGRGTTAFQALLMGRRSCATDVNPVAYVVSKAKLRSPSLPTLLARIRTLQSRYESAETDQLVSGLPAFFHACFAPETLRQLAFLRDALRWKQFDSDAMIAALTLGSLHGETERSTMYLSAQMPRTVSTKPEYSLRYWAKHGYKAPERNVFGLLEDRARFRFVSEPPCLRGDVWLDDMRRAAGHIPSGSVHLIVTSPPYFDVTSFEEDQWLRLWFLGGASHPTYGRVSTDDRHSSVKKYWAMIADFWRTSAAVLQANGHVVIRIAGKNLSTGTLRSGLIASAVGAGRTVSLESVQESALVRRQTDSFRPGSRGVRCEVDFHFRMT